MQNLRPTGNERSVQVMNKKKYSSIWRVYVSELYRLFHKRSFWFAFMVLFCMRRQIIYILPVG